eukprot:TRINITY_DN21268_c0_g1_i1.p1 TRINITY_DN21268_c0_g1~~TRINITY_DN21268_c0_g1_i1.p1  ORF type:complete len:287 (+),score=63.02 TRINITY_DN21268_c0_g1_i1:82-942(+)
MPGDNGDTPAGALLVNPMNVEGVMQRIGSATPELAAKGALHAQLTPIAARYVDRAAAAFAERSAEFACRLARHRGADAVGPEDMQLAMRMLKGIHVNMTFPAAPVDYDVAKVTGVAPEPPVEAVPTSVSAESTGRATPEPQPTKAVADGPPEPDWQTLLTEFLTKHAPNVRNPATTAADTLEKYADQGGWNVWKLVHQRFGVSLPKEPEAPAAAPTPPPKPKRKGLRFAKSATTPPPDSHSPAAQSASPAAQTTPEPTATDPPAKKRRLALKPSSRAPPRDSASPH